MNEQDQVAASKAPSRALRHRPDAAGLTLGAHGWCSVELLLDGLSRAGVSLKFRISENGLWLVLTVPAQLIRRLP